VDLEQKKKNKGETAMKVLLVDVDGKMPNLALMKISAYHKGKGDVVGFDISRPNKVYISCVFSHNRSKALGLAQFWQSIGVEVEVGGSGVDLTTKLPDEIEHTRPDYSLYGIRYSVGFTSRGCIRNCPWCIVPKKEGSIREWAPIDEFYVPYWRKLLLYDNNFLASPKWYEKLREIIARKIKICFNQGLDIRLIDKENAKLLVKCHYYDDQFKVRRLYFAFDLPEIEDQVLHGIETLKKAGIPPSHLMFYVLVGYNTTYHEDMHRINLLIKEGVLPYVMPYNNRKDNYYPHLARWINRRLYNWVSWQKYDRGSSQKIISKLLEATHEH